MISRNVIHAAFDLADSAGDSSSGPLANKSLMSCRFLRGTMTFVFFSSATGAMLLLCSAYRIFALHNESAIKGDR